MIAILRLARCGLRNNMASWRPGYNLQPPITVWLLDRFAVGGEGGVLGGGSAARSSGEKMRGSSRSPRWGLEAQGGVLRGGGGGHYAPPNQLGMRPSPLPSRGSP